MTAKKRINTAAFYIVAIALAVLAMVPFLWMIATSFKSRGALMSIPIEWLPKEPTWDAYIKVFSKFPFAKPLPIRCLFPLPIRPSRCSPPLWRPLPLPKYGSSGTGFC